MALNWDLSKIKDWETVTKVVADHDSPMDGYKTGDLIRSPVTNSLIWATLGIGIGEITEANYREFYGRLRVYEKTMGTFLTRSFDAVRVDDPITLAQVRAHIGLRTNVFPKVKAGEWLQRLTDTLVREAEEVEARAAKQENAG